MIRQERAKQFAPGKHSPRKSGNTNGRNAERFRRKRQPRLRQHSLNSKRAIEFVR